MRDGFLCLVLLPAAIHQLRQPNKYQPRVTVTSSYTEKTDSWMWTWAVLTVLRHHVKHLQCVISLNMDPNSTPAAKLSACDSSKSLYCCRREDIWQKCVSVQHVHSTAHINLAPLAAAYIRSILPGHRLPLRQDCDEDCGKKKNEFQPSASRHDGGKEPRKK